MQLGEAAGAAAALAVQDGVAPRDLDVQKLQRHLLQQGFYLGEPARLAQTRPHRLPETVLTHLPLSTSS